MSLPISRKEYNELLASLSFSERKESQPIEMSEEWKDYVTQPIIKHALAPREARAILDVFGKLGDYGIRPNKILYKLLDEYFEAV